MAENIAKILPKVLGERWSTDAALNMLDFEKLLVL